MPSIHHWLAWTVRENDWDIANNLGTKRWIDTNYTTTYGAHGAAKHTHFLVTIVSEEFNVMGISIFREEIEVTISSLYLSRCPQWHAHIIAYTMPSVARTYRLHDALNGTHISPTRCPRWHAHIAYTMPSVARTCRLHDALSGTHISPTRRPRWHAHIAYTMPSVARTYRLHDALSGTHISPT